VALAEVASGGGQCEAISALKAFNDLPRALTKTSASPGFFTVVKEAKMVFALDI
jgi:hypothetical protein